MARALVNKTQAGESRNPFTVEQTAGDSVPPFGAGSPERNVYPNESILLEIYNFTNDYLETVYRPSAYNVENYKVSIDVEKILQQQRYYSGKYNVRARFLRNYLGSGDGNKLVIQEISADRLEIRVTPIIPADATDLMATAFEQAFAEDFFKIEKNSVLPNLFLFRNTFETYKVFDYVQDPFTVSDYPYSIIFKLTAPLPLTIKVDDLLWLAQEVSAPISDSVTVIPPKPQVNYTYIGPANFDIVSDKITNVSTNYKDWDDVLSSNTDTSLSIIQRMFSGSLVEGIKLNVDFKKFENYIHFGSAEERLRNFKYKLELLEFYDERIDALSQSYANTPAYSANSGLTGSQYFVANVTDAKAKKSAILGAFDTYENYLYYQSSSYESSSFGEFYPTTWPKQNSTLPYVNYPSTSSEGLAWFNGVIQSASVYDLNNPNNLRQLIPEHVYNVPSNDQYILFIDMMGHYFDIIYQYIKQLPTIYERYESLTEGFAKDLVYTIGENLGLNTENGSQLEELWTYVLGTDVNGNLTSPTYGFSMEDKTKETWKRIITNLPFLLKTKGTARGIRALVNCYGIPSTILRVKEYGGPEPSFTTATQLDYDQFYYGLMVSGSQQITIPVANYLDSDGSTGGYSALELRFRVDTSILTSSANYSLLSGPISVTVNPGANSVTVGSQTFTVPLSEDDTDWWTVLVNAGSGAYVGTNKYGKALIYSSSASPGSISSPSTALIPGSGTPKFYGVVNEFRLWKSVIDLDVYENHILAPTSFQGPLDGRIVGSTSSFSTLKVRHTFGSDGRKFNALATASVTSSHPDQTSLRYSTSAVRGASFSSYSADTASYWIPQIETHYLEYVDGGANRNIGNKVRIDSVIVSDQQLQLQGTIQDSLLDTYPVDSARVSVAFSPSDEVNEDISEQFGGLNLDDFLGVPGDYYRNEYTELEKLKHHYIKKYQKRNNVQGFIRLTENYDSSLFQLIKQFVPERAALQTGLLVESHLLHRNKIGQLKPSYEDLSYTSSIQLIRDQEGYIQDMDGDWRSPGGYVFDTEIDAKHTELESDTIQLEGETEQVPVELPTQILSDSMVMEDVGIDTTIALIGSDLNEYNNESVLSIDDTITLPFGNASQYYYYAWFKTGSADQDWAYLPSVGADYSDGVQPTILQNRLSDIYTTEIDRLMGYGFFDKIPTTQTTAYLTRLGIETTLGDITISGDTLTLTYVP